MDGVQYSENMTPSTRTAGKLKDRHITFCDNGFKSVARTKERFEKTNPICRKSQSGRTVFRAPRGLKSDLKKTNPICRKSKSGIDLKLVYRNTLCHKGLQQD
jgi:hypothetical protein